jgi:hypothetical protein
VKELKKNLQNRELNSTQIINKISRKVYNKVKDFGDFHQGYFMIVNKQEKGYQWIEEMSRLLAIICEERFRDSETCQHQLLFFD